MGTFPYKEKFSRLYITLSQIIKENEEKETRSDSDQSKNTRNTHKTKQSPNVIDSANVLSGLVQTISKFWYVFCMVDKR